MPLPVLLLAAWGRGAGGLSTVTVTLASSVLGPKLGEWYGSPLEKARETVRGEGQGEAVGVVSKNDISKEFGGEISSLGMGGRGEPGVRRGNNPGLPLAGKVFPCSCVCECVHACVHVCVCVCMSAHGGERVRV